MDRRCFVWVLAIFANSIASIHTQSAPNFHKCKSISVSGSRNYPTYNGIYDKVFECNSRSMYRLRGQTPNKPVFLYYRMGEDRWAIGAPTTLSNCGTMTRQYSIVGAGNKLYPHLVEADWSEYAAGAWTSNTEISVECDDVFWTMGCSTLDFPLPQHPTRCRNSTNSIHIHAMYVINYPAGVAPQKCPHSDGRCIILGECDLDNIGLQCKKKILETDYEMKLARAHCDGRHINCSPFRVDPLFHKECDIRPTFECNERKPDIRDGIVLEYKCKKSRKYIGPDVPPDTTDLEEKPIQTVTNCGTTSKPKQKSDVGENNNADETLIKIVAPSAGALFAIILLIVIIVTVRRRRNRKRATTVKEKKDFEMGKASNEYVSHNTYANITSFDKQPSPRAPKRPDVAVKKSKKSNKQTSSQGSEEVPFSGDMSTRTLDAVVKAVVDANPDLQAGQNGPNNGMYTVVILDKQEVQPDHAVGQKAPPNGQLLAPPGQSSRAGTHPNPPPLRDQPGPSSYPDSRSGSVHSSRHSSHSSRSTQKHHIGEPSITYQDSPFNKHNSYNSRHLTVPTVTGASVQGSVAPSGRGGPGGRGDPSVMGGPSGRGGSSLHGGPSGRGGSSVQGGPSGRGGPNGRGGSRPGDRGDHIPMSANKRDTTGPGAPRPNRDGSSHDPDVDQPANGHPPRRDLKNYPKKGGKGKPKGKQKKKNVKGKEPKKQAPVHNGHLQVPPEINSSHINHSYTT